MVTRFPQTERLDTGRIAVTGATGFIGRHVLAELERRDVSPVIIARHPQPHLAHQVVVFDVRHPPDAAFKQMRCPGTLLHLAWGGLPDYRSPSHLEQELPGHLGYLSALAESGLRNLVVAGTCLEYGMQMGELSEAKPASPTVPYAIAKDRLRRGLEALTCRSAFCMTWARIFYTFGDGQAPSALLSQLKAAVARGDRVFDMSGGAQVRDYLPVEEVARELVDLTLTGADNGVVNVCSGHGVTVRELVEGWIAEQGWDIEPRLGRYPYPDYEPMSFWGDRSKADRLLRAKVRDDVI